MSGPLYVLDANVFIEAANHYYAFDFNAPFWDGLKKQGRAGKICTIGPIQREIAKGKDELHKWFDAHFCDFTFETNGKDVLTKVGEVMAWSQANTQFTQAAKAEFAAAADAWVVAYGAAKKITVVTLETLDPKIRNRVKIPNACQAFQVPTMNTFQLMRALGMKLS